MDWDLLPTELLEIIFKYIDNTDDLLKLQRVCRRWQLIITPMICGWRELCEKHVPLFWFRFAIMKSKHGVMGPRYYEDAKRLSLDFWRKLYGSWRHWQSLMELPQSVKIVDHGLQLLESEEITCIATDEDVVAFGTTEGNIYFSHGLEWSRPFFIAHHEHAVTSIKFWTCTEFLNRPMYHLVISTCNQSNHLNYWDYVERRVVKDQDSSKGKLPIIENYKCLSVDGDQVALLGWHSGKVRRERSINVPLARKEKIVGIIPRSSWHFMPRAMILTFNGKRTTIYKICDHGGPCCHKYDTSSYLPREILLSKKKKFYLLSDDFVICLTGRLVAFSDIDEWKVYDTVDTLGGHVRSVCSDLDIFAWSSAFLFGLDSGAVCLFNIDYLFDLDDFDIATALTYKVIFGTQPIIAVDILRPKPKHNYIIAATNKNIYVDKTIVKC